jgi:hypothetical protein
MKEDENGGEDEEENIALLKMRNRLSFFSARTLVIYVYLCGSLFD